jgi:hypothetical protein
MTLARTDVARALIAAALAATLVGSLATAPSAAEQTTPSHAWGSVHTVAKERVRLLHDVAIAADGTRVVTWEGVVDRRSTARAQVRSASGSWSKRVTLSAPGEAVSGVVPVAWGKNVSVFWERKVGVNDWQFRMRTLGADGWQRIRTLATAHYAFNGFEVDVDDVGAIVLAWEGGDHRVHAAVLGADGPWRRLRSVAVRSPGTTFRFIDNPRAAFLRADGRPQLVVWGRHRGTKGRALWSARWTGAKWAYARIGPTGGDRLEYNWVAQTRFAADPGGDLAAVWSQQDPQTRRWTTLLRYDPEGPAKPRVRTLGHARCNPDWRWCADVAMSDAGTAIVAWAQRGSGAQNVLVGRQPRHGGLTRVERLYDETVSYVFSGVAVVANRRGDATVDFLGGGANVIYQEFARCPASGRCLPLEQSRNSPSWLDTAAMAVAPSGATMTAWVTGCIGEACAHDRVFARELHAPR